MIRAVQLVAALLAVVSTTPVQAEMPKAFKFIVASTPGGGSDIVARMLSEYVGRAHNVPIVIENRPGAGNTIGTGVAARAAPDGATLLVNTPEFVISPHLRDLGYDPLKAFVPICYLARSPQLLVVNASSPFRTLTELIAAAKKDPGSITIASAGPGSSPHLAIETLKYQAKVDITYVPFAGSGPAMTAVAGGHVNAALAAFPNAVEQVKSGQLRALAFASAQRVDDLPNVPTMIESGFETVESDLWYGLVAPAGTPPSVIAELETWVVTALKEPELVAKFKSIGLFTTSECGNDFARFMRKEFDKSGAIIREANIKP